MNDADRKAFEIVAKDWATKSSGKDLGEYFWQAACKWRDSQAGRPIATVVAGDPEGKNHMSWLLDIPCPVGTKFYELPPAAQINRQLVEALQYAKRFLNSKDHDIEYIEAILAAAKETK